MNEAVHICIALYVVVFFTLTDRASTIPSNVRGFEFEAFTVFRSAAQSLVKWFYYRTLQIETGEKRGKGVEEEWPRAVIYLEVMHLSLIVRRNYAPPHVST